MQWFGDDDNAFIRPQKRKDQSSELNRHSDKEAIDSKDISKKKTEVHRTQFIFGLQGQKAAAERRRFDVNKIINSSQNVDFVPSSGVETNVHNDDGRCSSGGDELCNQSFDASDCLTSRTPEYSTKNIICNSILDSQEELPSPRSSIVERKTLYGNSSSSVYTTSTESYTMFNTESKHDKKRYCCGQARCWIVAFVATLVMATMGGYIIFINSAVTTQSEGLGSNSTHTTNMPSSFSTNSPSWWPSNVPSSVPSNHRPSYSPTNIFREKQSRAPSVPPSNVPSSSPSTSPHVAASDQPSTVPSLHPSVTPTTNKPSHMPTHINQWFEIRGRLSGTTKIRGYGDFGQSVSLSKDGNSLAVAALADDEVHVYDNVDGSWLMRGTPIGPPPDPSESKPLMVAIEVYVSADGNTVAIGGRDYSVGRGIVRVFRWDGVTWSQMGQTLLGIGNYDYFGICLALSASGLDLAIGARRKRSLVYNFDGTTWVQRGSSHVEPVTSGLAMNQDSISITEDGQYYAVGAEREEFVLVFKWNGLDWVQLGSILEPTIKNNREYGSGVALKKMVSGKLVLAVLETKDGGEVRVYEFDLKENNNVSTDWVERNGLIASAGSLSMGYSLAMSDDGNIIVTCTYKDVIMFEWDGSAWISRGKVLTTHSSPHNYGYGGDFWIAMSGNGSIVAVGMPFDEDTFWNGENLGQARTFSMQRAER